MNTESLNAKEIASIRIGLELVDAFYNCRALDWRPEIISRSEQERIGSDPCDSAGIRKLLQQIQIPKCGACAEVCFCGYTQAAHDDGCRGQFADAMVRFSTDIEPLSDLKEELKDEYQLWLEYKIKTTGRTCGFHNAAFNLALKYYQMFLEDSKKTLGALAAVYKYIDPGVRSLDSLWSTPEGALSYLAEIESEDPEDRSYYELETRWLYHVHPMLGADPPDKVDAQAPYPPEKKIYVVYINHGDGKGNQVDSLWFDIETARTYASARQDELEDSAEVWVDEEDEYTVN